MSDENGLPRTNGSGRRIPAGDDPAPNPAPGSPREPSRAKLRARRRRAIRLAAQDSPAEPQPPSGSRAGQRAVHGGALGIRVSDFFGELAGELARRWLSLLLIPGVLVLAAGFAGLHLRQQHALDVNRLAAAVGGTAAELAGWPGVAQAVAAVGVILAAVAAGLLVQALVGPVRALCLGHWTGRVVERVADSQIRRRQGHWRELYRERAALEMVHPAHDRTTEQQRRIDRIAGRTNQIAMAEPGSPTWMGDRIHALTEVAINRYGLDLAFGWPRLWLVLPADVRAGINTAQRGFAAAVLIITWSLPWFALGLLWWPAALAGVVIAAAGRSRSRARITSLTEQVEAALDIHGRSLAVALGVAAATSTGPLTREEGERITDITRKER